jgi:hypothetical protein
VKLPLGFSAEQKNRKPEQIGFTSLKAFLFDDKFLKNTTTFTFITSNFVLKLKSRPEIGTEMKRTVHSPELYFYGAI